MDYIEPSEVANTFLAYGTSKFSLLISQLLL